MEQNRNYYDVLEVTPEASQDDIYRGYVRAKNAYSQDSLALYSLMTKEECQQILDLIEEAYSVLSDPSKRKQYDDVRGINRGMQRVMRAASPGLTASDNSDHHLQQAPDSTAENSMTKIVAKKRFGLEYNEDLEFEREIENTTEFTGAFLKKIREYKNVELDRLADMTKISKSYIRYIEDEDFDKLPAEAYVRGFVYQMGKCLKLNPDLVATSYLYRMKKVKGQK
ncbi:MAG: hypothetical protein Fur0010_21840 [Bdellovibrio sp.]